MDDFADIKWTHKRMGDPVQRTMHKASGSRWSAIIRQSNDLNTRWLRVEITGRWIFETTHYTCEFMTVRAAKKRAADVLRRNTPFYPE